MHRRVINAVCTFQLKRHFNILRNSVIYAEVEIANITTPIAGTGDDTPNQDKTYILLRNNFIKQMSQNIGDRQLRIRSSQFYAHRKQKGKGVSAHGMKNQFHSDGASLKQQI